MNSHKLTTPAEVACYLAAHGVGIFALRAEVLYLMPNMPSLVRQNSIGVAFAIVTSSQIANILIVMFLFLLARKYLASYGGKLTNVDEVGSYLLAHLVNIAIVTFWSSNVVSYLYKNYGDGWFSTSIGLANTTVVTIIVMFIFLLVRMRLIDSAERLPKRTIERVTYFWWWILTTVLSIASVVAINSAELEGPRGGVGLIIFAIVAIAATLIIRVATAILRLRDIGWNSWLSVISVLPLANMLFDIVLIFKPAAPTAKSLAY